MKLIANFVTSKLSGSSTKGYQESSIKFIQLCRTFIQYSLLALYSSSECDRHNSVLGCTTQN